MSSRNFRMWPALALALALLVVAVWHWRVPDELARAQGPTNQPTERFREPRVAMDGREHHA